MTSCVLLKNKKFSQSYTTELNLVTRKLFPIIVDSKKVRAKSIEEINGTVFGFIKKLNKNFNIWDYLESSV